MWPISGSLDFFNLVESFDGLNVDFLSNPGLYLSKQFKFHLLVFQYSFHIGVHGYWFRCSGRIIWIFIWKFCSTFLDDYELYVFRMWVVKMNIHIWVSFTQVFKLFSISSYKYRRDQDHRFLIIFKGLTGMNIFYISIYLQYTLLFIARCWCTFLYLLKVFVQFTFFILFSCIGHWGK